MTMSNFEIGDDFYIKFVFKEDVSSYTVLVRYKNANGYSAWVSPTSVSGNIVRYDVPYTANTVTGRWQFKARVLKNGKRYKTNTVNVYVVDTWE